MSEEGNQTEATGDLAVAVNGLHNKQARITTLWDYYRGRHQLKWSLAKLQEVFQNQQVSFVQNWVYVVIASVLERIELVRFDTDKEASTQLLEDMFTDLDGQLEAEAVHEEVLVAGEAFLVAGRDPDDNIELYHNDAKNMLAVYDVERPRQMNFAAKWWAGTGDTIRLNLYYPDKVMYYIKKGKLSEAGGSTKGWAPYVSPETGEGEAVHDFTGIPVFHFRRDKKGIPEALNILPVQDAVNKLTADMMVCAEFAAFPQRWIISNAENDGKVPYGSFSTLEIPAGDGESQGSAAGTFPAADLGNFLKAIESNAHAIAIISRTPKHYFLAQGGAPSGEALLAMEAPLVKKVGKVISNMLPTWKAVAMFLLEDDNITITPVYTNPATVLPVTESGNRKTDVEAGIPLVTSLRMAGWTQAQLAAMAEDAGAVDDTGEGDNTKVTSPKEGQGLAEQAAGQEAAIATQAIAIKDALAQALEAITVEKVDQIVKSGALDRLKGPKKDDSK